jgi:ADP-dependent NAD(P)H-hydrate dehydratase / NAD(P)H-hydrate epimerase
VKALVACAEASRLDAATRDSAALPPLILMEDAAMGLWRALEPIAAARSAGQDRALVALCGPGNNGGDALALLRLARFSGLGRLGAILAKEPGELASAYVASLRALGLPVLDWKTERGACEKLLAEASLLVDGLSGTGLSGSLRGETASLLAAANEAVEGGSAAIASIDLPSGLSDDFAESWPLARASWTLSVEPRKACLYYPAVRDSVGEIIPIEGIFPSDAAIAAEASLLEEADLASLAPPPPESAYKGSRGRVAVFAGSIGTSGAAVLSSRSCLAAGAGLVSLFASAELYPFVAPMLEAVMAKPESESFAELSAKYDAILVGPGWGRTERRSAQLASLLDTGLPAVLDADAIVLYRGLLDSGYRPRSSVILTPHPGEFFALSGIESGVSLSSPASCLGEAAKRLGAVIVFKSSVTWIASSSGALSVWDGREAGLGTAGSGDVLAGLAAGLLARLAVSRKSPQPAFDAARAAVLAHGLAGRGLRRERGWFESGALPEAAARILGRPKD